MSVEPSQTLICPIHCCVMIKYIRLACFWRASLASFHAFHPSRCYSELWMTMDFDADHAVSSASPGCCTWWCRQDACPHERARVGAARPRRHCSPEPDVSGDRRRQANMQLQRNQKGFPLFKVPFKNANCCKCCRSWGSFYCSQRMLQTCGENPRQRCMESDASLLSRRENTQD